MSLTIARMSRRAVLQRFGAAALLGGALLQLAACGGTAAGIAQGSSAAVVATSAAPPAPTTVPQTVTTQAPPTVSPPAPTVAPSPSAASSSLNCVYWAGGTEQIKVAQASLAQFGKAYPSIHVEDGGAKGVAKDILPLAAAGTPPDWALLASSADEATLAWKGALADLSSYIAGDKVDGSLFWPSAWDMRLVQGKPVGLTPAADIQLMFFNKTLFQGDGVALPTDLEQSKTWDWAHFHQAATSLTKRTGSQQVADVYGFEFPPALQYLLPFLATWGAWVLSDDLSTPTLQTPEMAAAIDALVTLTAKDQSAFPPGIPNAPGFLAMEKAGRVAMAQVWDARGAIWRPLHFDWDAIGSVPVATHGQQTLMDGTPMTLFAESKQQDNAWALTRWLLTPGPNLDLNLGFASAPALRANLAPFQAAVAKQGKPANVNAYNEALQVARVIPLTPAYNDLESAWDTTTIPLWLGNADAKSTLASLTTQFTTILAKYK